VVAAAKFNRELGNYLKEHRNPPKNPMGDLFEKRKVTVPVMSTAEMANGIQQQVILL
jgi:hypothetical protein